MRVTKSKWKFLEKKYKGTCFDCGLNFKANSKEVYGQTYSRDGQDMAHVKCTNCNKELWVYRD